MELRWERAWISITYLFGSYKALGGNGIGEILYNRASALEIREEN